VQRVLRPIRGERLDDTTEETDDDRVRIVPGVHPGDGVCCSVSRSQTKSVVTPPVDPGISHHEDNELKVENELNVKGKIDVGNGRWVRKQFEDRCRGS